MTLGNDLNQRIDLAAKEWRQGDAIFSDGMSFSHVADLRSPLTDVAKSYADEGSLAEGEDSVASVYTEVPGFAVLTQTCDLQRSTDKPYVEVCPLVEVSEEVLNEIKQHKRPTFAYIEGVADKFLVADLSRIMTVEKSLLLDWERVEGCPCDRSRRLFADAISRKRARFAFPDDFNVLLTDFARRIKRNSRKMSNEGVIIRNLREIRVRAAPSWDAEEIELVFYFIKDGDLLDTNTELENVIADWMSLIKIGGRFSSSNHRIRKLRDLRADEYVDSDRIDLDHLSIND